MEEKERQREETKEGKKEGRKGGREGGKGGGREGRREGLPFPYERMDTVSTDHIWTLQIFLLSDVTDQKQCVEVSMHAHQSPSTPSSPPKTNPSFSNQLPPSPSSWTGQLLLGRKRANLTYKWYNMLREKDRARGEKQAPGVGVEGA